MNTRHFTRFFKVFVSNDKFASRIDIRKIKGGRRPGIVKLFMNCIHVPLKQLKTGGFSFMVKYARY